MSLQMQEIESYVMNTIRDLKDEQKNWRALSVEERVERVFRLKSIIKDRADEIVDVMTSDGKPEFEAFGQEVGLTLRLIDYYSQIASDLMKARISKFDQGLKKCLLDTILFSGKNAEKLREPYGVFGMIPAWNGAFQFTFGDAVPALLAGNTVISKPSELVNPDMVELMQEIVEEAELAHVFRIVQGGPDAGRALVKGVDGVHFTGSTKVGRKIQRACFERSMDEGREIPFIGEMGGYDPMIVFPDCDGERAVNAAVWGRCNNSGQNCNAVKAVYYVGPADKARNFACRVAAEMDNLEQGRDYGPVINEDQFRTLEAQLSEMLDKDSVECLQPDDPQRIIREADCAPWFFPPVVLFDENQQSLPRACKDETFGPILLISPVDGAGQAIQAVNESRYALSASVWTNNDDIEQKMVRDLDVGNVCIRDVLVNYAVVDLPFVGRRDSGTGLRHGKEGFLIFTRLKSVLRASKRANDKEDYWFPYERNLYPFATMEKLFRFLTKNIL